MRVSSLVAVSLAVAVSGAAGFAGARALAAAEQKTHLEAGIAELDRSEMFLRGHLASATASMKRIAAETTAENAEPMKKEREAALQAAVQPLMEDAAVLLIQGHLLCYDNVADKTGEPAEQLLQLVIYGKLGVTAEEVAKRRQDTGLGHDSLILGYLIAKISKSPADAIFAAKASAKSWPEVMRMKNVSAGQLISTLEGK